MEEQFLQTVEEHQNIIHKICHLYRDTKEDREDLFQEVVYQLWKSFPNFRKESKVTTWMYRIALSTAVATFRKKKPPLVFKDKIPERDHPQNPDAPSNNEEQMYAALQKLSEAERAIITLYLDDFSYAEIASIVGISENYVGVRINRIKNKLRNILN